jgi:CheY-like chemotaxis protein
MRSDRAIRASTDALPPIGGDRERVPLRVILVDDDDRFRAMARRTLESDGVDVVAEVGNGAGALAAVLKWRPDLVLLDIGLPDIDGLEVARRLQAEAAGSAVILISTRDGEYGCRVAAGLAAGYLPKDELSLAGIGRLIDLG